MAISLDQLRACLKKVNPSLRVYSIDGSWHTPASIVRYGQEDSPFCAVNKQNIPEYSRFNEQNILQSRGWRQVGAILEGKRIIHNKAKFFKYIRRAELGMVL
ncbi:MAG: hypothetical protein QME51_04130 [Planctomycetota bacterium]|nr:hypothetical protein [Planctomycetota bacterium]